MFTPDPLELYSIAILKPNTPHPEYLSTIHALSGCDTVSSPHRIGKKKALDMMRDPAVDPLQKFRDSGSTHEDIQEAGEWALLKLYSAVRCTTLDRLRYIKQAQIVGKAAISKSFELASLPLTSGAAKFHSYRAYHTVQQWMSNELSPLEWGWRYIDNQLTPVTTDLEAAPDKLLRQVSCGCKMAEG